VTVSHAEVVSVVLPLEQHFGGASGLRGRLAGQHLTIPDLYGLVQRLLLVQKVARVIAGQEISDRELRSRYAQERLQFTVLHAAHIMLRDRRTAAKIANEATPSNFARLARRSSTDTATASRGGDLGAIPATQLASTDPAFLRAALALRPGQISGPVRTSVGWEVIRLISTRLIPFSRAREQLLSQLSGSAFTSWLQRRFRSGGIDVNPRYGRLDPRTELVEPITCTAATPAPGCAAT
jgi:hypothetical protein